MSAEDDFAALTKLVSEDVTTALLLGSKRKDEQSLHRMLISESVAADFSSYANDAIYYSKDRVLKPYTAGYQPDESELSYIRLAEHPDIKNEVERMEQVNQAPNLQPTDTIIRAMNFYSTVLANAKASAVFVKKYSRSKELTQKRVLSVIFRSGAFDELHERVFMFDGSFDCYAFNEHLFILNQRAFESIFGFYDPLIATTEEHIDEILDRIPIQNGDEFKQACLGHTNMMTKLAHIASKPFLKNIGMAEMEAAIAKCGLDIKIHDDGKSRSLIFDGSMKNRWLILKLLEDDYLESLCAKQIYESNSKAPLTLPTVP